MQICEDIFTTGDDAILSYGNHKIQVYDLKKKGNLFFDNSTNRAYIINHCIQWKIVRRSGDIP